MKAKRSPGQNISWCQAFGMALSSGINGPKKKTNAPPAHVARGNEDSPHRDGDNKNNSPVAPDDKGITVAADISDSTTSLQAKYNRESTDIEEEKTEIRAPEDSDDWDDNASESTDM